MINKLKPCIKGYVPQSLFSMITVIGEVLMEVYLPFLMADIIDIGVNTGDMGFILRRGVLMVGCAAVALIFGVLCARFAVDASTGFACNLRNRLFARVQDFSFSNMDKFSNASLITRLTTDVTNVQQAFMMTIRGLVRSPIMLIAALIMACRINAGLAMIFAVALPVLAGTLAFVASKTFPRFKAMLKKYDDMNAEVQENLTAIRVVKAYVREDYETRRFDDAASAVREAQIKAEKLLVSAMPVCMLVMYGCTIAVCWFGGRLVIGGTMQTGELMSFIAYISQILSSLMMLSMMFIMLVLTRASMSRICEVLSEPTEITDADADAALKVADGSVAFENVSFAYTKGGNTVLSDISLDIRSGETVGIIGGTGSAKTSLVQLIPRLYDASAGRVLVGGHDVRSYTLKALRGDVAMVLQKNELFSGTIKENLKWGNPDATNAELTAACENASADGFIRACPDGYDTQLGQGGVNLSGGQKQRLCIARALLKKPKVIILDDSTSAVDTATDASIRAALKAQLRGTTTIIIAQRIASVMDADKIVVLNDGKIDAVGTHETLLRSNAIYREVFESQQKGVA